MSATPTRLDWKASANLAPTVEEGNRVLDSIGRQETLRALLAFSDLHGNIRLRRVAEPSTDQDLFQTERFVLHEILRLICERAQTLTGADAILVALFEGPQLVSRASAGPNPIPQGIHLNTRSSFLNAALESGQILRCDDANSDVRVECDFARQFGAQSTVLVPLRGRAQLLGVLQAFSANPWAFTDQDVRCLDLFAELVLAAVKPEDQDRRFHWLSNVAGEVLQTATSAAEPALTEPAAVEPTIIQPAIEPAATEPAPVVPGHVIAAPAKQALPAATYPEPAPIEAAHFELERPEQPEAGTAAGTATPPTKTEASSIDQSVTLALDLNRLTEPVLIPVSVVELTDAEASDVFVNEARADHAQSPLSEEELAGLADQELQSATDVDEEESSNEVVLPFPASPIPTAEIRTGKLRARVHRANLAASPLTSHPGLAAVIGLVAIAALFSAGVWWGMQYHGQPSSAKIAGGPRSVTSPAAPDVSMPPAPDNLMASASQNPAAQSDDSPLTPVPDAKLAALPKITGVRHWSSSLGSTVVIDMEDQVNYEVHRLMSPERIYFDLHDTALPATLDGKTMDVGDTSLTRVRVAQPVAGVTRVVLDTKGGSNFSVSMETNPYRLVVELRDAPKAVATNRLAPATSKPVSAAPETTTASTPPIPARTGKFRIVLDAGHGGWDLGTVGRQGLMEKDLVLDVTKRLGQLLQSRLGADVLFTRSGDEYLALDQRADYANQAQADLFVSIHANYSSLATARGVETYYTNVFAAPGSKEIEKHADGTFTQPTPISLTPGALHEKIEESRRLATSVQHSLYLTLAAKSPDIRDRGIKDASFVVLTGTTMPAILTEISFVSSPADEQSLQSDAYRQQIAEALYKGISHYEDSSPRTKVAQLRPSANGR
jgi:N-acetylmuramoyl-L-alanine amidase/putative methionine-R-sulfoxide reductase with GAF domain